MSTYSDEIAVEYNKATALLNKKNYKKALSMYKKCITKFEFKEAYLNMGSCYRGLGIDNKMIECYKMALEKSIPYLDNASTEEYYPLALNNLGLAYYMQGNDDLAIDCYTLAIKVDPQNWNVWWNNSTAHLRKASSGRTELFPEAWEMYKARFLKSPPIVMKNDNPDLVYWDMKSDADSILVLTEQGSGDAIMWGRYLKLLSTKVKKIYVQCAPQNADLFSEYNIVQHASEADTNLAIPMCSLSAAFEEVPSPHWLPKFDTHKFPESDKLNIGIVWQGATGHVNDAYRSVNMHRFHKLAKYANLFCLSPGFSGSKHIKPLDITTWTSTAEYINGLDIVITVDTSVAHLAASLGAKTWLLQPMKETDFRWGNNVRSCVWYPDVRIFNNPNDWDFVFDQVEEALREELYL